MMNCMKQVVISNNMATAIRVLLSHIKDEVHQLRGAAQQLATSSQQISSSTSAQSDSAPASMAAGS